MGDAGKSTFNVGCRQGYAHVNLLSHLSGWVVKGCRRDTSTEWLRLWISKNPVCLRIYGRGMNIQIELDTLAQRIRQIREAQGLTLQQVSARSKGRISAIALGSYERGDRSISAKKILEIAEIYAIPAGEFFTPAQQGLEAGRVVIDLRKLTISEDPIGKQFLIILKRIVEQRRDWNGEVISLRAGDISNLQTFAHFSSAELSQALDKFALSKFAPTQ